MARKLLITMGMLFKRPILLVPVICIFFGCGTEIKRIVEQKEPVFSVGEPDKDEGLQLTITDKIDDLGEHHLQLGISLKNARDGSGRTWADVLGNSFLVQISDQKILLKTEKAAEDQKPEDQDYKASLPDSLKLTEMFGSSLLLASESGKKRSSLAQLPVSLSSISEKYKPLDQRILSNCKSDPLDVDFGLKWNGRNDGALSLMGGSGQEFKVQVPDTGYWQATRDLFETFFGKGQIASGSGGTQNAADQTSIPLFFERITSSSLRVASNDHIDRSMLVTIRIDLELQYNLRYIAACKDI